MAYTDCKWRIPTANGVHRLQMAQTAYMTCGIAAVMGAATKVEISRFYTRLLQGQNPLMVVSAAYNVCFGDIKAKLPSVVTCHQPCEETLTLDLFKRTKKTKQITSYDPLEKHLGSGIEPRMLGKMTELMRTEDLLHHVLKTTRKFDEIWILLGCLTSWRTLEDLAVFLRTIDWSAVTTPERETPPIVLYGTAKVPRMTTEVQRILKSTNRNSAALVPTTSSLLLASNAVALGFPIVPSSVSPGSFMMRANVKNPVVKRYTLSSGRKPKSFGIWHLSSAPQNVSQSEVLPKVDEPGKIDKPAQAPSSVPGSVVSTFVESLRLRKTMMAQYVDKVMSKIGGDGLAGEKANQLLPLRVWDPLSLDPQLLIELALCTVVASEAVVPDNQKPAISPFVCDLFLTATLWNLTSTTAFSFRDDCSLKSGFSKEKNTAEKDTFKNHEFQVRQLESLSNWITTILEEIKDVRLKNRDDLLGQNGTRIFRKEWAVPGPGDAQVPSFFRLALDCIAGSPATGPSDLVPYIVSERRERIVIATTLAIASCRNKGVVFSAIKMLDDLASSMQSCPRPIHILCDPPCREALSRHSKFSWNVLQQISARWFILQSSGMPNKRHSGYGADNHSIDYLMQIT